MPPIPDAHLEQRILKAAQQLWRTHGEKGLTLRAVARKAGTTVPTVYKRFPSKQALQLALAYRVRDELIADLFLSSSMEEVCRRYLLYAEEHAQEYPLLRMWASHFFSAEPQPGRAWLRNQFAARFGGQPTDYARVCDALLLLCHGASSFLIPVMDKQARDAIRDSCIKVCDKLIENVAMLRAS